MSGLETLPPDQRAVLQLILRQGRGYEELARLLTIDVAAVRERAHAGAEALGGAGSGAPDRADRARIADYLLGQQDEAERIVTLAALGESPAAHGWASTLSAALAPLAREPLPELPALAAGNGAPARAPARAAAPPPARPVPPARPSSRLGGAILLGGLALLLVVLAIVLVAGGGDEDPAADRAGAGTTAARTQTQPSPRTTPQAAPVLDQVNLTATDAGGEAAGIGFVQRDGRKLVMALQAQKLAPNTGDDIYATWLEGPPGTKLLGFVPSRVGKDGTFAVAADLPRDARSYNAVIVSRETGTDVPQAPGEIVLRGALTLPAR